MAHGKKGSGDAAIREAERNVNDGNPIVAHPNALLPILEDVKTLESSIAEERGGLSALWKRYEEKGGVKDVGRVIKKLSKMTLSQRSDWFRQFDLLRKFAFQEDPKDMLDGHDNAEAADDAGGGEVGAAAPAKAPRKSSRAAGAAESGATIQ